MRSTVVGIVAAVIVLALAGAAYYYWTGGRAGEAQAILGQVVAKERRQAGTEAGDAPLQQGMRILAGQSQQQDMYHFLVLETTDGDRVDLEVSADFYQQVRVGDTVQRATPEAAPIIVSQAEEDEPWVQP